jgi:hypothetical protein
MRSVRITCDNIAEAHTLRDLIRTECSRLINYVEVKENEVVAELTEDLVNPPNIFNDFFTMLGGACCDKGI